ncbi:hypothetical protein BC937DRAFT_93039 [Endogone sp. FLAS-F59071]|nr:hypothetical protein BC937DRAFT_93039 [Endogone sp. FLAS-F59071]|eukprot:RUS15005.1 hypothetical protein BC937DRAFT_93039 [Endogone sp. FLAS-F59071]
MDSPISEQQQSIFSRLLTDTELTAVSANPLEAFDRLTQHLRSIPDYPIYWHNRARILLRMGHHDLAICDARRAALLMDTIGPNTILALTLLYFTSPDVSIILREKRTLIAEIGYTYAQALTATPPSSEYFIFALTALKNAIATVGPNNDPVFHAKAKQLQERVKEKYQEHLVTIKDLQPGDRHPDSIAKNIYRPNMQDGRYPWDTWNTRSQVTQNEEGLRALEKEYNNVLAKLEASKIKVKFSYSEDGEGETDNVQTGIFANFGIGANETVLDEKPSVSVNRVLSKSVCENCNALCRPRARRYICPHCTEVYCSEQCREDANSTYHKVLCRNQHIAGMVQRVQAAETTPSIIPLIIFKLFAMSTQTGVPLLELPAIRRLRPRVPCPSDGIYQFIPFAFDVYNSAIKAINIKPEQWLDFDYWIFDTIYRMLLVNIFGRNLIQKTDPCDAAMVFEAKSWFNHSCDPNCASSGCAMKTLRTVKADEELTISYTDASLPKFERQKRLWATYGFICACKRCKADKSKDFVLV